MLKVTTKELVLSALFTAFIAIGAFIKIPFGDAPMTLQLAFVILAGQILGAKVGGFSAFSYMLLGLIGIPIFTEGGGIGYLFKPTFGFIIGFFFASVIVGFIIEKSMKNNIAIYFSAAVVGMIVIYVFGIAYFYFIKDLYFGKDIGFAKAITIFIPFIPKDLISCFVASLISFKLRPIMQKIV